MEARDKIEPRSLLNAESLKMLHCIQLSRGRENRCWILLDELWNLRRRIDWMFVMEKREKSAGVDEWTMTKDWVTLAVYLKQVWGIGESFVEIWIFMTILIIASKFSIILEIIFTTTCRSRLSKKLFTLSTCNKKFPSKKSFPATTSAITKFEMKS